MVSHSGRASDTRRIRRLKTPDRIEVDLTDEGVPSRVRLHGAWQDVSPVRKPWRIDQHWWRSEPVSRLYYRVAPPDGSAFTVYQDLSSGEWSRQEYR